LIYVFEFLIETHRSNPFIGELSEFSFDRDFPRVTEERYVPMQGPSELGLSGKLIDWDRTADLNRIAVPTLVIGARYDTMDPRHLEMMSQRVQKGQYLYCPEGSHLSIYDDQKLYFEGLIQFIRDVEAGRF
jgi:proline iminopeptidase